MSVMPTSDSEFPSDIAFRRSNEKLDKLTALTLRAAIYNWLACSDVVVAAPSRIAEQILCALDALAIVHGYEDTARDTDAAMAKLTGAKRG